MTEPIGVPRNYYSLIIPYAAAMVQSFRRFVTNLCTFEGTSRDWSEWLALRESVLRNLQLREALCKRQADRSRFIWAYSTDRINLYG